MRDCTFYKYGQTSIIGNEQIVVDKNPSTGHENLKVKICEVAKDVFNTCNALELVPYLLKQLFTECWQHKT